MGRRKKAVKKVVKKKRATVAKVFKCLYCNNEKSVTCKINTSSMTGDLQCSICDAKFQTQINTLTEPIDIFTEWLDEASEMQAQSTMHHGNRNINTNNNNNSSNISRKHEEEENDEDEDEEDNEEEQ